MAPRDGEAFLISRMKRLPACASASERLRFVGVARSLSESGLAPSKRLARSARLDSAMSPRTPSATADLHEIAQQLPCPAGRNRLLRTLDAFAKVRCDPCDFEQRAGVDCDDRPLCLGP